MVQVKGSTQDTENKIPLNRAYSGSRPCLCLFLVDFGFLCMKSGGESNIDVLCSSLIPVQAPFCLLVFDYSAPLFFNTLPSLLLLHECVLYIKVCLCLIHLYLEIFLLPLHYDNESVPKSSICNPI